MEDVPRLFYDGILDLFLRDGILAFVHHRGGLVSRNAKGPVEVAVRECQSVQEQQQPAGRPMESLVKNGNVFRPRLFASNM
jgi:hypothetical protein